MLTRILVVNLLDTKISVAVCTKYFSVERLQFYKKKLYSEELARRSRAAHKGRTATVTFRIISQ